jgi:hypothetical protein
MKYKILLIGLMLILSIGIVSASDFEPNSYTNIYSEYTLNGVYSESVSILTIQSPSGVIILNNTEMIEINTGRFNYQYTFPEEIGSYFMKVVFYDTNLDNKTMLGIDSKYIDIGIFDKVVWGVCPATKTGQASMWLIIGFCVVFAIVGFGIKNVMMSLLSGACIFFMTLVIIPCGAMFGYITALTGLTIIISALSMKY